MKGVIYARFSSDNQREESVEGQIRECKAYAEKNGITVIDSYVDRALSGKTDNRPVFAEAGKHGAAPSQKQLKEAEKSIENMLNAIAQGIITPSTKQRLTEYEEAKN